MRRIATLRTLVASIVAAVVLSATACGGDDDGQVDGAASADGPVGLDGRGGLDTEGCRRQWTVSVAGGASAAGAAVAGGALVLRNATTALGDQLDVMHLTTLTGDFDASFAYEMFVAGGAGAFAQAVLIHAPSAPGDPLVTAGIGNSPQPAVSATFQPGPVDVQVTAAVAGTFRLRRSGDQVTTTTTPTGGDPPATVTSTLATYPLGIGLQLGTNTNALVGETSIRINDFTVTGDGSVSPDDFSCDSVSLQ